MTQTAPDPFSMFTFDLSPDLRIPELPGSGITETKEQKSCTKKNSSKLSVPSTGQKGKKISSYTKVIHDLAENPYTDGFISWTRDGKFLYVRDSTQLCGELERGKYFRSSKFASIVRNLNYHCFRKLRFDEIDSNLRQELDSVPHLEGARHLFFHPHFQRGRADLLPMIKSQKTDDKKNGEKKNVTTLEQVNSSANICTIVKSEEEMDNSNCSDMFVNKETELLNIIAQKDALLAEKDAEIATLRSSIDTGVKRKLATAYSFDSEGGYNYVNKQQKMSDEPTDALLYDALFDEFGKQGYFGDNNEMDSDLPALL